MHRLLIIACLAALASPQVVVSPHGPENPQDSRHDSERVGGGGMVIHHESTCSASSGPGAPRRWP